MTAKRYTIISILLLFFLSALIMLRQLMSSVYFSCIIEDTYIFTRWTSQFVEALNEGILYPRWLPFNFWGYGSPTFILYPPLAFYLAAFFNVFTGSIITAMNITKFTALFFSSIGMFYLVREFYSEKVALLTASFYILFPYNIFGLYYIETFASSISLMWFAPIILFTYRYTRDRHYKNLLYVGICYGGLILTHLINAYMFTFILVTFIITICIAKKRPKDLFVIPFIITIGFLISAGYILPLIYEIQFIQMKAFIGEGTGYYFKDFFIQNLAKNLPPGNFWPFYYDMLIFFVAFFCIFIALFFIQVIKLSRNGTKKEFNVVNIFFLGIAIGSIFLLLDFSTFIWVTIPFFQYIQFPHRWLHITTFAVVFLSATVLRDIKASNKNESRYRSYIVLSFLVYLLLGYSLILDYKYIKFAHGFKQQALIAAKTKYFAVEHLPLGVTMDKIDKDEKSQEKVFLIKGEGKTKIEKWNYAERVIAISAQEPLTVRIRTFNFPGWKAYIDSRLTEIRTEEGTGAMIISIPEGEHRVELKFMDTPIRFYSKIISFVSFFVIFVIALFFGRTHHKL